MVMFCCILRVKDYMMAEGRQIGEGLFLKRPYARCHRFTTDNQNASVFCFFVQIRAFVVLNLAGITKFKYERKNEMDSGSGEMTASCKWPILLLFLYEEKVYSVFDRCVFTGISFESNVLYLFFCRILNEDNTEWHYAAKYPFMSWDFSYIYIAVDLYTFYFHSP